MISVEKTVELLCDDFEKLDKGLENLDNYVNEMELRHLHRIEALEKNEALNLKVNTLTTMMSNVMTTITEFGHRLTVLEKEFNCTNFLTQKLGRIERELGLDDKPKPFTQEQMKTKHLNGRDFLGDGGEQ